MRSKGNYTGSYTVENRVIIAGILNYFRYSYTLLQPSRKYDVEDNNQFNKDQIDFSCILQCRILQYRVD
jgi:hypothetical protein